MEFNANFKNVYNSYVTSRKIKLTENQFMAMVTTLPALLVAKADGIFDAKEKSYMKDIAGNLAQSFKIELLSDEKVKELAEIFNKEFDYILNNISDWQVSFIEVIADYLDQNSEQKESIKKMIYGVAEASEGICPEEQYFINHLSNTLKL